MVKCLVCSQQRTGSNMLRTMLVQQPGLRVGGEVCNRVIDKWWHRWTNVPPPPTVVNLGLMMRRPDAHLQAMWNTFDVWNLQDRWIYNEDGEWTDFDSEDWDIRFHNALLGHNFKIIWLSREDLVAQAVSFLLAIRTKHWISYRSTDTDYSCSLPPLLVESHVNAFKRQRKRIKELFAPYEDCIDVTYEQLAQDSDEVLRRVTDFLEIPCTPCKPRTHKTFVTPTPHLVVNYDEIVRHCNGT